MKTGQQLKIEGIEKALQAADNRDHRWSAIAYQFLLDFSKHNKQFMAEDVRTASDGIVPEPPSKRAWGGIFVSARRNKLIRSVGFGLVKNPKAHRTPATVWESI